LDMNPRIQDAGFIFIAEAEDLYHKRNQLMPVRRATLFRNHVISTDRQDNLCSAENKLLGAVLGTSLLAQMARAFTTRLTARCPG